MAIVSLADWEEAVTSKPGNVSSDTFDYELEFLMCTIFSVPLGIGALYIAVAQLVYFIQKIVVKKQYSSRHNGTRTRSSSTTAKTQEKFATVINGMCAFAAVCAFLRAGIDFRLTLGKNTDLGCDVAIKFKLANYMLALVTVYLVLWMRQRIFYQHPRLNHLSSTFIRFVSGGMSIVIIVGVATLAIMFFAVGKYLGTPNGCVVQEGPLTTIRWIILIGCTTFFQVCLLTLFIYPLMKHNSGVMSSSQAPALNTIIPLIKRATITSAVCVFTDIFFAALIMLLRKKVVTMSTFIYDVNIVINVVCTVLSFPDWKKRLLPWKLRNLESNETMQNSLESCQHQSVESLSTQV